jgi:putative transposase
MVLDRSAPDQQDKVMGRPLRTTIGGLVYHVLNRANRRAALFAGADEYAAFLRTLAEAQQEHPMRLLAYCVMPNHWHLVVWPERDRELSRFVGWLTLTHTQRRHAARGTVGSGHVYQGRFKSFPVEADDHLLVVCRYVERNAVRAGLVARAAEWPWGSLYQRVRGAGAEADRPMLAEPPVPWPQGWAAWVDSPQTAAEEAVIRRCMRRGRPFGRSGWVEHTVAAFGLGSTLRRPGRPRKAPNPAQRLLFDETVPDA